MSLYDNLIEILPELKDSELFRNGIITLQNDSDGQGDYIAAWNYDKPLPQGFKLGK